MSIVMVLVEWATGAGGGGGERQGAFLINSNIKKKVINNYITHSKHYV